MTHFEIRKIFLDFFKERGHKILPSSSLIPQKDPSLLFVNAGMNQFKSVILGLEKPPEKNVVTIQKCLRAGGKHNDLENVGQTSYHHTFFEMMGNFSFGGYFKKQAIGLAWEFLTQKLKLPLEDLWVSVYEKDEESYEIWRNEQKIPENKIYRMGKEDNFWQMGDTGPCGPCTEIHYYGGKEKTPDPSQLIEIWNLVFMEFDDKGSGKREKLSVPCVDTGMGLERLCAILQNKKSNYHTDYFKEIISSLEKASGCKYDFTETDQNEKQMAFRVLADHSRAAAFLMSDGVLPGNEGRSYVLRRILRRAFFYSHKLNPKVNLPQKGAEALISLMKDIYPELEREVGLITSHIEAEDKQFSESLSFAIKTFSKKEKWTDLHELKSLQLYKKINKGEEKEQLFEELSKDSDFIQAKIPKSSIEMKVKNFEFLDTEKSGLQNASKKSKEIFNKYGSLSIEKLQAVIEKSQDKKCLDSSLVWYFYSTHGLPFDLTRLMAEEQGYQVNLEEVEKLKEKQISDFEKKTGQGDQENLLQGLSQLALLRGLKETKFTGYETKTETSRILEIGSLSEDKELTS
ncbi:MAG: alanine--tRNA ligase, partial [Bdellovibrionales bacterium]|nr:alanine--tRNA ligase [Bdellovibrionales bacterium]